MPCIRPLSYESDLQKRALNYLLCYLLCKNIIIVTKIENIDSLQHSVFIWP